MGLMLDPFDCNETLHYRVWQNFVNYSCIDVVYRWLYRYFTKKFGRFFDSCKTLWVGSVANVFCILK